MDSLRSSRTSLTLLLPLDDPQMCDGIFKGRGKLQAVSFPHRAGFPARTPTAKGKYPSQHPKCGGRWWTPSLGASRTGSGRLGQVLSRWAELGTEELAVPKRDQMGSTEGFPGGFQGYQTKESRRAAVRSRFQGS